jgi:hypothetical protein
MFMLSVRFTKLCLLGWYGQQLSRFLKSGINLDFRHDGGSNECLRIPKRMFVTIVSPVSLCRAEADNCHLQS